MIQKVNYENYQRYENSNEMKGKQNILYFSSNLINSQEIIRKLSLFEFGSKEINKIKLKGKNLVKEISGDNNKQYYVCKNQFSF